ncbi:MAG TPA: glycosyltransferase family 2 protein [Terriglobales bacterium]|jgi:glycosyltransferase involved in cell wall biosynthesis|nr:glycosyltransferase family 2 protein [Terriglobales bacterium]
MQPSLLDSARPEVSVVVPARNEEASLGACLESLAGQQGVPFEIIVVDDGSTDRTAAIACSFPGVKVLEAGPLPEGWSGKSNAVYSGAQQTRGQWLLFTDADTVHLPGSLARALDEAKRHGAAMLSYSPAQEVHGFIQRAVMPVIFAELASTYRPREVDDPDSPAAAANGQYLLITRQAYYAVGGHAAIAKCLLEDVELARAVKHSGCVIRFRFGGDAVRTRMYRSCAQLVEGWTKNLALLFKTPTRLALRRLLEFVAIVGSLALVAREFSQSDSRLALLAGTAAVLINLNFFRRIRKAHAGGVSSALAVFGLPIFSYLLLRSELYYKWRRSVTWKGRHYSTEPPNPQNERRTSACPAGERWSI